MSNINWLAVSKTMQTHLQEHIQLEKASPVGGGSINQAWKIHDQQQRTWFVKQNHKHLLPMFEAEYKGLQEIADSQTIRVPNPLCTGVTQQHAFLVMEYIAFHGTPTAEHLGQQLATLHHTTQSHFGWTQDNTIGSTPQHNPSYDDWVSFWRYERLEYQLKRAQEQGLPSHTFRQGMQLATQLDCFFSTYTPRASLLHGDLWSGNYSADQHGQPVIYDPAVYYGDHEADLAMMELFGAPSEYFFSVYDDHFTIDEGYKTRKTLYNLYHILNHFNLFGSSYASQAHRMIEQLLAEI